LKKKHRTHPIKIQRHGTVYQNKYYSISRVTADFGRFFKEYFVTDYGVGVGVLVIDGQSVLLTCQYRLLINDLSWEIPGGAIDAGESPEAAASRECLEETGVICKNLKPLVTYQADLDTLNNPSHIYYTHDFEITDGCLIQKHEAVGHEWVHIDQCMEMIRYGRITDCFTMMTLFSYVVYKGMNWIF